MTVRTPADVQHVRPIVQRVSFDATNPQHREIAENFLFKRMRSTLNFQLEGHYVSIPDMLKDRLLEYFFAQEKK